MFSKTKEDLLIISSTRVTCEGNRREVVTKIEGEDPSLYVEVATYHYPERKIYRTSATAMERDSDGVIRIRARLRNAPVSPFATVVTPVGRHSRNALERAHREAYTAIESHALELSLYEWAREYVGRAPIN